jgi:GT2 family glycosyltransferase
MSPGSMIAHAPNREFPAAVNRGLEYALGGYPVLGNNDVVVTEWWLELLVALTSVQGGSTERGRGRN